MKVDEAFESGTMHRMIELGTMKWSKPSLAVVANHGDAGCVLYTAGPHVASHLEQIGPRLDDLWLDDAPRGITVWEGVYGPHRLPSMDDVDDGCELVGTFRAPTSNEWDAIVRGSNPWRMEAWSTNPVAPDGEVDVQCTCGAIGYHYCPNAHDVVPTDVEPEAPFEHHPECTDPHCSGGC